jgi:DGQHR domain-containing protein
MKYIPSPNDDSVGTIRFDLNAMTNATTIFVSRVDGNHRLHYADGTSEGFKPIEREVSFCLAYKLDLKEEITLFRDINDNQRRMNTSHLDNIQARLTPEARLKRDDPSLYIAERLGDDPDSPFNDCVHEGGKRPPQCFMPLRNLKSGIRYMFSQPSKLTELRDVDAQYAVIRNYFNAIKKWEPEAWKEPRKYVLLRGAGFWGICFIGASVIDRALSKGKYSTESLVHILRSGPTWDWSTRGDFMGLSGRGGAVKIRDKVVNALEDPSGVNVAELAKKIIGD